jgi:hypothetical protein
MLLYDDMKNRGRFGDTELAHVNPQEMALLQALGGSGTINPFTGMPEFFKPGWSSDETGWSEGELVQMSGEGPGGGGPGGGGGGSLVIGKMFQDQDSVVPSVENPDWIQPEGTILSSQVGSNPNKYKRPDGTFDMGYYDGQKIVSAPANYVQGEGGVWTYTGGETTTQTPDYQTTDPNVANYIDPSWIENWQSSGFTSGGGATSPEMYIKMKRLSDPNWQIPDEWKVPWKTDRTGKDKDLGINLGDQLGLDASLGDKLTATGEGDWSGPIDIFGLNAGLGDHYGLNAGLQEHIEGGGWTNWIPTSSAGGQGTKTQESYTDPLMETAENGTTSDNGSSSGSSVEGGMTEDQFKEYLFGKMRGEIDTPYEAYDDTKRFADFDPMQDTAFDKVATFGASTPQELKDAATAARGETGYTSGYGAGTSTSGYAPTDYTSGYTTAGADPAAFQREIDARMSPFTGSVINQLQKDITEQQQLALGQTGEQARASGAFGGSRQGVAEGITSGRYADAFGRTAGELRADQFNKAVAGADVDRQMRERFGQGAYGLTQQARQAKEGFRQGAFGQTEQARQAEETAKRLAASTRLVAGSELRTTGQALDDAEARRINALSAAGAQKQDLDQALKDFQYNQFVEGRDWDKGNILAGGGLIGAVPPDDPPVYGRGGGILDKFMEILFGKNQQIA